MGTERYTFLYRCMAFVARVFHRSDVSSRAAHSATWSPKREGSSADDGANDFWHNHAYDRRNNMRGDPCCVHGKGGSQ